jgi:hypothetical protein
MKPAQDKPFLDEQGVRITKTHLTTQSHTVEFRKILSARIDLKFGNFLQRLIKRPPTFQLVICTSSDGVVLSVFESKDALFMERIQQAMDRAAKLAGAEIKHPATAHLR